MTQKSTFWEGRKIGFPGGYIKNKGAIEKSVYVPLFSGIFFMCSNFQPRPGWFTHKRASCYWGQKTSSRCWVPQRFNSRWNLVKSAGTETTNTLGSGFKCDFLFWRGFGRGDSIENLIEFSFSSSGRSRLDVMLPFTKKWGSFTLGFQTHCEEVFGPCVYPFKRKHVCSQYIVARVLTCWHVLFEIWRVRFKHPNKGTGFQEIVDASHGIIKLLHPSGWGVKIKLFKDERLHVEILHAAHLLQTFQQVNPVLIKWIYHIFFWMTHQSHQSFWLSSIRFELGSCKGQNAQRTQHPWPKQHSSTKFTPLKINIVHQKITQLKRNIIFQTFIFVHQFSIVYPPEKFLYICVWCIFSKKKKNDSTTVKHHEMDHANISKSNALLAGGFKYVLFGTLPGEMIPNLTCAYFFQRGWIIETTIQPGQKKPGEVVSLFGTFVFSTSSGSPNPKGTANVNQTTKARSSGLGGFFAGATLAAQKWSGKRERYALPKC